jgi:uncharacterized membrane protein
MNMNMKRYWLAVVAVFIATTIFGVLIHGTLLFDDYRALPNDLVRPIADANAHMHFMFLGMLSSSLAMVWIYAQVVTEKPWLRQGIRFGIAVWMLKTVPMFLIYYFTSPYPPDLVMKQIGFEFIAVTTLGVIAAAIYRRDFHRASIH